MSLTSEIPIGLYMLFVNLRNQCDFFCHIKDPIPVQPQPPAQSRISVCAVVLCFVV